MADAEHSGQGASPKEVQVPETATPAVAAATPPAASPPPASPPLASPPQASPPASPPASQPASQPAAPPTATSPKSTSSPKSAKSGTRSPEIEGVLQPGEHWLEQPIEEDDNDSAVGEENASSTASLSSSILRYRTLNGRTYHSEQGNSVYWGPNDTLQNNTLDIVHHACTLMCEDKLYFAPLKDDIQKVIDLGTGTGLWAIDFGDERPGTEVVGTDLSPIQPIWVPPNVSFVIDDFKQVWTFADNSVDYIHLRWLVGAVDDWDDLFAQAYRTLKPGGWIESLDCNGAFESDDDTVDDTTAASQWGYIFREGMRKLNMPASFSVVRDELQRKGIEAAGFVDIHEKPLQMPISEWPQDPRAREVGLFCRAALENDIEGLIGFMASQLGWSPTAVHVYAAHVRREMRSLKVHGFIRFNAVWAQKPLE